MNSKLLSRSLILLALPLFLGACQSTSTRSVSVIAPIAKIPDTLLGECKDPVEIPERNLKSTEVAKLWGQDRQSLADCRDDKHAENLAVRVQQREDKSR